MNLFLVRHGFSTGNRDGRIQGQWDTELTTDGRRQAGATGRFLAHYFAGMGWRVNALYSSDLRRAWHTAEVIGRYLHLTPIRVPGLREMHAGLVEGMTTEEWQALYPEVEQGWRDRTDLDFGWPGGETRRQLVERVTNTIKSIVARHAPLDNVVAVTHGGVIRAYLNNSVTRSAALVDAEMGAGNCSISQIQYDAHGGQIGIGCLLMLNNREHLADPVADAVPAPDPSAPVVADADAHLQ
jgi:broad specificity phosphatase PhoE